MSVFFRLGRQGAPASVFFRRARRGGLLGLALLAAACMVLFHPDRALAAGPGKAPRAAATPPAPPPLRIGEINTYKALPDYSTPYRLGWALALEQINAEGGVLGRKLQVLSRDDHGDPDDAVRTAQALVDKDGVTALFGGYSSEVALALSRYADTAKVLYLAVSPLSQRLTWQEGNRYTFRLRPAAWMQAAAVAPKALGLRKLRWALVYPDTESDRATADAFKGLMKTFQSKTGFVAELAVAPGKFDAAATVAALAAAKPEAIFNTLTGRELAELVRAGMSAHLFDGVGVVSPFLGDPENLAALDAALPDGAIPDGWIVTGYPRDAIDTPENQAFVQAYRDRYGEAPGMAAVLGYSALRSIAEGLKRAGAPDRETLAAAFPRLQVPTPFGAIEYRNLDHQSTLGIYLGYTGHADGHLVMDRFVYATGARLQPLDEQIRRLRVQAARANTGQDVLPARDAPGPARDQSAPGAAQEPDAPGTAAPAHSVTGASRPLARPDTALTSRLRGARPGTAPVAPAAGERTQPPGAAAPPPIGTPSSSRSGAAEASLRSARPGVETRSPAMADWPDHVSQGAAAH